MKKMTKAMCHKCKKEMHEGKKMMHEAKAEMKHHKDPKKKHHKESSAFKAKTEKVMHEFKEGKLHSGSKKGPEVRNRRQAVAIA